MTEPRRPSPRRDATDADRDPMQDAACLGENPQWWDVKSGQLSRENYKAIRICQQRCPVRAHCRLGTRQSLHHGTIRAGVVIPRHGTT